MAEFIFILRWYWNVNFSQNRAILYDTWGVSRNFNKKASQLRETTRFCDDIIFIFCVYNERNVDQIYLWYNNGSIITMGICHNSPQVLLWAHCSRLGQLTRWLERRHSHDKERICWNGNHRHNGRPSPQYPPGPRPRIDLTLRSRPESINWFRAFFIMEGRSIIKSYSCATFWTADMSINNSYCHTFWLI